MAILKKALLHGSWLHSVLICMLALMLVLSVASAAYAVTTQGVQVVSSDSNITVHVYDNNNAMPENSGNGTYIESASSDASGDGDGGEDLGNPIGGVTLRYAKVGEIVQYTDKGSTIITYAVSQDAMDELDLPTDGKTTIMINDVAHYLFDSADLSSLKRTSSDLNEILKSSSVLADNTCETSSSGEDLGSVTVSGLSGLYLFVGDSMPTNVTSEIAPFFVSAPMPNNGTWLTDIHAYPKVQSTDEPAIDKMVRYASSTSDADYVESMSANSNTPLQYRIQVMVPGDVQNLNVLTVTDELPDGVELLADPEVSVSIAGSDLLTVEDFAIDIDPSNEVPLLSIKHESASKFDDIADDVVISLVYKAEIINGASLAEALVNKAKLDFQLGASKPGSDSDTAIVYTYGIDLIKTFVGASEYQVGTKFKLFTDEACSDSNVVKVGESSEGVYWVDDAGNNDDNQMAVVPSGSGSDGSLIIRGLAEGTYYLKEVIAPSGYSALVAPIKIVVQKSAEGDDLQMQIKTPDAYVDDDAVTIVPRTAENEAGSTEQIGLAQLTVENEPENFFTKLLPKTGDTGTFFLIATGLALICAAVIFLLLRHRGNVKQRR